MPSNASFDLKQYARKNGRIVDQALNKLLPSARTKPTTIHRAMRHSLFAGGKRVRPTLALAAAEACGGSIENALPVALSLIHI